MRGVHETMHRAGSNEKEIFFSVSPNAGAREQEEDQNRQETNGWEVACAAPDDFIASGMNSFRRGFKGSGRSMEEEPISGYKPWPLRGTRAVRGTKPRLLAGQCANRDAGRSGRPVWCSLLPAYLGAGLLSGMLFLVLSRRCLLLSWGRCGRLLPGFLFPRSPSIIPLAVLPGVCLALLLLLDRQA